MPQGGVAAVEKGRAEWTEMEEKQKLKQEQMKLS